MIGTAVIGLTYSVLGVFAVLGLYRIALVCRYLRLPGDPPSSAPATLPPVTVQLPVYNERFVIERLLRAVAALDYPHDRLDVQVLDDSTDDTSRVIERVLASLPPTLRVRHLRRDVREGYKAGALHAGMAAGTAPLIAIFDADFVPEPDFLREMVGEFEAPDVGMVQARWGFMNADASRLCAAQSVLINAHFEIEHRVRQHSGSLFNFNGTAGVWRRAAIEAAGGWRADTLTEDLDLSYRAQLAGWRFRYARHVVVPSELPADVRAFRSQQARWSQGMTQVAVRTLPRVFRSSLPLSAKIDAFFHLSSNLGYVLVVAMAVLVVPTHWFFAESFAWAQGYGLVASTLLITNVGSVVTFLSLAAVRSPRRGRIWGVRVAATLPMGFAVGVAGGVAALRGLGSVGGEFVRTPKGREGGVVYRLRRPSSVFAEALLALYLLGWFVVTARGGRLDLALLSIFLASGFVWFVTLELGGARRNGKLVSSPARHESSSFAN